MDKDFVEFCDAALKEWGEESQLRMCIEEMSELTKEICKYIRYCNSESTDDICEKIKQTKKNIIEETADVLNCASQLALMYGEKEVEKLRKQKVERTKKILKKYN